MGHGHCHSLNHLSSIQLFDGCSFHYCFDAGNACNVVLKQLLLLLEEFVEQCLRPC
jgi:hypothetical protein